MPFSAQKLAKRACFEVLQKSKNMTSVVLNEESKTGRGLEIGHRQQNADVRPMSN